MPINFVQNGVSCFIQHAALQVQTIDWNDFVWSARQLFDSGCCESCHRISLKIHYKEYHDVENRCCHDIDSNDTSTTSQISMIDTTLRRTKQQFWGGCT